MERLELKATLGVDEAGAIEGIAWPYEAGPDRIGDLIERGAFNIKQMPLPMLDSHNTDAPIGVWDDVRETAEGLRVKGRLLVADVQRAREVRALIRERAITGLSIGYRTTKAEPRKGGGRTIASLDLYEVSPVVIPAHPAARIVSAKAAPAAMEESRVDEQNQGAAPDFAAIETKVAELGDTVKGLGGLASRLDKLEARVQRPGAATVTADEQATIERKAFAAYLRLGNSAPADELKALVVSSDPQGGYLAPAELSSEMIHNLVEFSPIRELATVRSTGAPSVVYPTRTGVINAAWRGETQAQSGSEPGFGQTEIVVKELSTFVDVSNQLLADSGGQADAEVRLALAEDFGSKEGLAFVKGDSLLAPEGILSAAGVTPINVPIADFAANGLLASKMIDAFYAVPAAYRANATWLGSSEALAVLRKLADANGRSFWQPALSESVPETILGKRVVEVADLDDITVGNAPIVFGDIATAYRIVDRAAMSILVNPFLRATEGITRIHATRRVGGAVVKPAALRKIVIAA